MLKKLSSAKNALLALEILGRFSGPPSLLSMLWVYNQNSLQTPFALGHMGMHILQES